MSIIAKDSNNVDVRPLAPEGTFLGVCCDVIDFGMVETTWQGQTKQKHKIKIVFQLAELDDNNKPYEVGYYCTLSLSEKGNLRPFLESWRGKAFTPDELKDGFDVEKLIGANAVLVILHNKKADKTYANIKAASRPMKGMEKITVTPGYVRYKDRNPVQAQVANDPDWEKVEDDGLPF